MAAISKGAESALKMEEKRIQMFNEMLGKDFALQMNSNEVSCKLHVNGSKLISFVHICALYFGYSDILNEI